MYLWGSQEKCIFGLQCGISGKIKVPYKWLQRLIAVVVEETYNKLKYRVAQKSKPLPNDEKIVLKPVSVVRFIRQIKVWIKHYNIISWY